MNGSQRTWRLRYLSQNSQKDLIIDPTAIYQGSSPMKAMLHLNVDHVEIHAPSVTTGHQSKCYRAKSCRALVRITTYLGFIWTLKVQVAGFMVEF